MPAEHPNPYPHPTAEEVAAAPGSREQKAARNIASRAFDGIPRRAFLLGDADHSPVVKGIVDLTTEVYKLVDSLNIDWCGERGPKGMISEDTRIKITEIVTMLEDHRC